jgi:hypothetical protein
MYLKVYFKTDFSILKLILNTVFNVCHILFCLKRYFVEAINLYKILFYSILEFVWLFIISPLTASPKGTISLPSVCLFVILIRSAEFSGLFSAVDEDYSIEIWYDFISMIYR